MRLTQLMKPLSRFLQPAPPAPSVEASARKAEPAPADAIQQLPDGDALRVLAGLRPANSTATGSNAANSVRANPGSAERVAQERLAQIIDTQNGLFAELLASTGSTDALLSVAGMCSDPAHLARAFAALDPQRIAQLVTEGPSTQVRQFAAQRIEEPGELRRLLKQLRGRDKNVYKIIKQKCDALHGEETRQAQLQSDIEALCASLERHSHRLYDALYPVSLRQFAAQWRTLEAQAGADAQQRVTQAMARCREVIGAHERHLVEQAATAAQQVERHAAREAALTQAAEDAERRKAIAAQAAAEAGAEAAKIRDAQDKARADKLATEESAVRQMNGLIGKANGALREGNTGRAAGLRRAIEEKLPSMPVMPAYVTAQIQKLDAALNELKGWKEHAVASKRLELIEAMEALIGSTDTPEALADRIRQLQEDWKTISLGVISDSEADWQRFRQASQTAYQPCRDYFEAQAKQRRDNVERRREVLERLRAFEAAQSGEHPEWRAVATALREAPREWRGYSPVERGAVRAIQEEFDAITARLQSRLDAWHAQNAADKQALIQRAQGLLSSEDGREAVDGVKRLQQEWKAIGSARRDQEQQLWLAFREQCDAVYQKRQQAHSEYTAALEANKAQAMALCEQAETTATLTGTALLEGVGQIPQWRSTFEALGDMPRADERGLHDRFERAIKRCQEQVSQQRARDKDQSFLNLFEAARLIGDYACAEAADREARKLVAETFIGGVERWPKGGLEALKEAWVKAHSAAQLDFAAQETALRMLCIRAEIRTGSETPAADQALRREYQVQRLLQTMGQHSDPHADDQDALSMEWVRVGPATAAARQALFGRFLSCRQG
jgi:hypothetical protein